MWRDETQAWLIARDSRWPWEVIRNTRYEGHPWLWHLVLWGPSRLTWNPVAMQVVHGAIATGTVWLILRLAPFPWPVRLLLASGYFFAFEWAVISRNYALGALLLLGVAAAYARRWGSAIPMGLALGMACLTSIHAIIVVLAFLPALVIDYAVAWAGGHRQARSALGRAVAGGLIALTGLVAGIRSVIPPADTGFARGWYFRWEPERVARSAETVLAAHLPVPPDEPGFWGRNRWIEEGRKAPEHRSSWAVLPEHRVRLACAILLASLVLFFRRPWWWLAFATASLGLTTFFYIKYMGSIRHHGFHFLALVMAFWMSRHVQPWRLPWSRVDRWLGFLDAALPWVWVPLLCVHVWGAAVALRWTRNTVFSQARNAAAYLRERFPDRDAVVWAGHRGPEVSTVVAYLQLPRIYYLEREAWGSYLIWDQARLLPSDEPRLIRRLHALAAEAPRPIVFIASAPLSRRAAARGWNLLAEFVGSTTGENYHLYIHRRADAGAPDPGDR